MIDDPWRTPWQRRILEGRYPGTGRERDEVDEAFAHLKHFTDLRSSSRSLWSVAVRQRRWRRP